MSRIKSLFVMLIVSLVLSFDATLFTSMDCVDAPCIYADSRGEAGIRLANGDIDEVQGFALYIEEEGSAVRFYKGYKPEEMTAIEPATWRYIEVIHRGEVRVGCNGSTTFGANNFSALQQITMADVDRYTEEESWYLCHMIWGK